MFFNSCNFNRMTLQVSIELVRRHCAYGALLVAALIYCTSFSNNDSQIDAVFTRVLQQKI
jgi:hypothetical protein